SPIPVFYPLSLHDALPIFGSPWPKLTSGLTLTLQYGRLDFRAEFYGAFGHEYSNDYRLLTPALYNFPSGWGDQFWNGPGTSNERSEEHTSELQSRENLVCR